MSIKEEKKICGIVMPISTLDGCGEGHWADVLGIITEAIEQADFEGNLVSNADDVGIIQKRIIQNLYENPIVVCDVSGKNPNVMFELGMRLAFDKPTIIIKDDKTSYSFDTSPIEHIEYPRDLRFSRIVDFKLKLADKIKATFEKSINDPSYTTFLKYFGEFKVAKIDKKEVSGQEFMLDELKSIKMSMRMLERNQLGKDLFYRDEQFLHEEDIDFCAGDHSISEIRKAVNAISDSYGISSLQVIDVDPDHRHIKLKTRDSKNRNDIQSTLGKLLPKGKHTRHTASRKDS